MLRHQVQTICHRQDSLGDITLYRIKETLKNHRENSNVAKNMTNEETAFEA